VAVAYAAESLELAVLEAFVRLRVDRPPLDYYWLEFEVPNDGIDSLDDPPPEWDSPGPYRSEVQAVGAAWVSEAQSLALRVPAAVLPERRNVLINPVHPRFAAIREVAAAPFTWPRQLLVYAESLGT
jgi:RES domain-containing protein